MKFGPLVSVWWQPQNPTDRLVGHVEEDDGGRIHLALVGAFSGIPGMPTLPLLHGSTSDGKLLTLVGLIATELKVPLLKGFPRSRFVAQELYVGANLTPGEAFDELVIEPTYLPEWAGVSGLSTKIGRHKGARTPSADVLYRWPKTRRAKTETGTRILLETAHETRQRRSARAITEQFVLRVRPDKEAPPNELVGSYGRALLDLVSLATQRPNTYSSVTLHSSRYSRRLRPRKIHYEDVEFRANWWSSDAVQEPTESAVGVQELLFTLADEVPPFEHIVPRWLELHKDLRDAVVPYFALIYAPPKFMDSRIIVLTQALEAYHRLRYPQTVIPKAEFRAVRKHLRARIPYRYRTFLGDRLGYLNEPTQRGRLAQLVATVTEALPGLFSPQPRFVEELTDERNRQTHPGGSRPRVLRTGPQLYRLATTAAYTFQSLLLLELGFSARQIAPLWQRNAEYTGFVAQLPTLL